MFLHIYMYAVKDMYAVFMSQVTLDLFFFVFKIFRVVSQHLVMLTPIKHYISQLHLLISNENIKTRS